MRGVILHAPGDVRVGQREDPKIEQPTDAIIRVTASCVCGSDLWPYRGEQDVDGPSPFGHEYVGIVQEVGSEVGTIKPDRPPVQTSAGDEHPEVLQIMGIGLDRVQ